MQPRIGMTALIPPEIIYGRGCKAIDLNNWVPDYMDTPPDKLCAWTASWRNMLLRDPSLLDALVVVAGGDCHNALVDGQRVARDTNIPVHYFFYPFDGDPDQLLRELESLDEFVRTVAGSFGATQDDTAPSIIRQVKSKGIKLDRLRVGSDADPTDVFGIMVSFSDLGGDIHSFSERVDELTRKLGREGKGERELKPVALLGVPPIMGDLHRVSYDIGLKVVLDELPNEFVTHDGTRLTEMARSYVDYSFARSLEFRMGRLVKEVKSRGCVGIVHYTQFACHHVLEDPIIRQYFDIPVLTIQGDLPRSCDRQVKLRLEAFYESL